MSFMFKRRPNQLFIGFSNSDTLEHLIKSITFATILFHSLNLSIILDALFFFSNARSNHQRHHEHNILTPREIVTYSLGL